MKKPVFRQETIPMVIFYDGWCPFCTQQAKRLKKLDWFGLVDAVSFREPDVCRAYGLDPERAARRIQAIVGRSGKRVEGFAVVVRVACRIPLYWPLLPALLAIRAVGLGDVLYDRFAARRTLIVPTCAGETCIPHFGYLQQSKEMEK
ncbi:MAG: hypothetical protein BLM47_11385 [Candidatus Reconcilbacillus cellulovorans]|uniref:DUF393 domain-containing protein n=1 Tax=Candidatus Reconcilbacillus cellulovorans TaxID=1906605 RepID=A0A2A6DYM4_9BACL|nr:MAG: hypothetical protein BLM47_11385 [Candidatus Reconcilbacillus cellulovorans]